MATSAATLRTSLVFSTLTEARQFDLDRNSRRPTRKNGYTKSTGKLRQLINRHLQPTHIVNQRANQ
jgi:hypothetical protein